MLKVDVNPTYTNLKAILSLRRTKRERERDRDIYTYIYIYICVPPVPSLQHPSGSHHPVLPSAQVTKLLSGDCSSKFILHGPKYTM